MPRRTAMGLFRGKVSSHLIRIHPDNATSKDWVILLEAGTIVGPSPERLRVARSTLERKIVKKYNIWLRPEDRHGALSRKSVKSSNPDPSGQRHKQGLGYLVRGGRARLPLPRKHPRPPDNAT